MDATNQKLLQNIMFQINNHPISHAFYHPLSANSSLDLKVVSNRIQQNSYKSISEFLSDIDTICTNAKLHIAQNRHYVVSADLFKKLVYKEIHHHAGIKNYHDWCNEVYRIRQKMQNLIYSPPIMPNDKFSTGIDPARPIEPQLPSESTLKKLVDLSTRTLSQNDTENVLQIIRHYQPSISIKDGLSVDVRKLSSPTINALINYMEKKIMNRAPPMPENISIFSGI